MSPELVLVIIFTASGLLGWFLALLIDAALDWMTHMRRSVPKRREFTYEGDVDDEDDERERDAAYKALNEALDWVKVP